ncbi:MAG: acyltransferase family protein [Lachnospiraceae bacterium]|nr:acyltransferase family protein [Lachnospiraceae bacterium]
MTAKPGDTIRNSYMDFLKGIAIITVIVGHSLSGIRRMDLLFNIIYSFHMPLLFFVSAYIEEQGRGKYAVQEGRMLIKRMSGLLLPYLSWTVIYTAVSGYGDNGLWFFPVLFGLKIMHSLYWVICRKSGKDTIFADILILGGLEIVCALLACLTRQPYLINMLSYAIPYFFAVLLVKHETIQKLVNSEWLTAGAILAYVMIFPYFSFYDTRWITQVVRVGLSLCIIVVCCRRIDSKCGREGNRLYSVLCVCGENSLAIYVLHGFLIDYKMYFDMIDSAFIAGILSVALACAVAAVCIIIAKIIGISSWWRRILFGR